MSIKAERDTQSMPPEPSPAAVDRPRLEDITDPDSRLVVPYEAPPNDNEEAREILANLACRPAPPPKDLPETDGDLAAAYAVPARPVPVGEPTPIPEPAIIVEDDRRAPTVRLERAIVAPPQRDPFARKHRAILAISAAAVSASTLLFCAAIAIVRRERSLAQAPPPTTTVVNHPMPIPVPRVPPEPQLPASAPSVVAVEAVRPLPEAPRSSALRIPRVPTKPHPETFELKALPTAAGSVPPTLELLH